MLMLRIADSEKPAFQLRKGEEGISVFVLDSVQPPLTEAELLAAFRPGSVVIVRNLDEIEAEGLRIVPVLGGESLPDRLRMAHAEIRPGAGMGRTAFKQALQELE